MYNDAPRICPRQVAVLVLLLLTIYGLGESITVYRMYDTIAPPCKVSQSPRCGTIRTTPYSLLGAQRYMHIAVRQPLKGVWNTCHQDQQQEDIYTVL